MTDRAHEQRLSRYRERQDAALRGIAISAAEFAESFERQAQATRQMGKTIGEWRAIFERRVADQ